MGTEEEHFQQRYQCGGLFAEARIFCFYWNLR
jgi:hypothetical protein